MREAVAAGVNDNMAHATLMCGIQDMAHFQKSHKKCTFSLIYQEQFAWTVPVITIFYVDGDVRGTQPTIVFDSCHGQMAVGIGCIVIYHFFSKFHGTVFYFTVQVEDE